MANEVLGLERCGKRWRVRARRGELEASAVVANVLPQSLWALTGSNEGELDVVDELARDVEKGWGACMLYRVVRRPRGAPSGPHHLELVRDPSAPFIEGNHLFCSFRGELDDDHTPKGYCSVTVSTHVPVAKLRALSLDQQASYIAKVQGEMRQTMAAAAPEWEEDVVDELTA